ncbi:hypothetical protein CKAH01_12378 [Colletotrichum kahawae]|uniref:Uncharacterized protein n=1 Tax=Colletotrichum kahawae TaxID=34407 RepID=A0AAD9YVA8_COLKA|nr:hypothetical protein CKAH01_12378 [Colletotrichum kahawae]
MGWRASAAAARRVQQQQQQQQQASAAVAAATKESERETGRGAEVRQRAESEGPQAIGHSSGGRVTFRRGSMEEIHT